MQPLSLVKGDQEKNVFNLQAAEGRLAQYRHNLWGGIGKISEIKQVFQGPFKNSI